MGGDSTPSQHHSQAAGYPVRESIRPREPPVARQNQSRTSRLFPETHRGNEAQAH